MYRYMYMHIFMSCYGVTLLVAWQLDSAIRLGQFTRVRNLVDGITDVDVIRDIEAKVG